MSIGDAAERRAPLTVAIDGGEVSEAGVIRAEDDEASRQLGGRIERRGDVAAVHQSRVRNDRADEALLRFRLRILGDAGRNLRREALRRPLVERAGDGGRADFHRLTLSHPAAQAHSLPL